MSFFNRLKKYPELKSSIINLKSGSVFSGVIFKIRGDFLILRNVKMLQDRGQRINDQIVDGEILILLSDIDFVQVV